MSKLKNIFFKKHFIFPKVKSFSPDVNNTCIVSVVNNSFVEYFKIFSKSIVEHNSYFNFDWIIFHGKSPEYRLSDKSMKILNKSYKNVFFREIDESLFSKFKDKVPSNLFASLFKIELFLLKKYSKIVCLDVDTLCMGDISLLFNKDFTLAASLSGGTYNDHLEMKNFYKRRYSWNAGIVVYGEKLINESIYDDLMNVDYFCETAEQTILNKYFRFFPKYLLPFEYNYHATKFGKDIENNDVRILHYAGIKPTQKPNLPQMKYWFEAKRRYS